MMYSRPWGLGMGRSKQQENTLLDMLVVSFFDEGLSW